MREKTVLCEKGIFSFTGRNVRVKKEITKFCNKLVMKASLAVEFNREKYNLNCKSHFYKKWKL